MRQTCKKCKKKFKVLADGICAYCDIKNWVAWANKQGKKKK